MTKINEIFRCSLCGNVVEIVHGKGSSEMLCCHQPMSLLEEKSADKTTEKHVPIIENIDGGVKVIVGSTLHPMEADHYIEWIEIIADNITYKQFLNPGDKPEAVFMVNAKNIVAREYCNKHGLWRN